MLIYLNLTTVGTKGGFTFLSNKSSQAISLKKACFFTSSASRSLDPSLLSGFFLSNCRWRKKKFSLKNVTTKFTITVSTFWINNILTLLIMAMASNDKNLGYRTSSLTIESKTSSSSSPGKGDCKIKFILLHFEIR